MSTQINLEDLTLLIKTKIQRMREKVKSHEHDQRRAYNMVYYWEMGELAALEDISALMGLFGESFGPHAKTLAEKRFKERIPTFSVSQDRGNGDSGWIYAYKKTMEDFGVEEISEPEPIRNP